MSAATREDLAQVNLRREISRKRAVLVIGAGVSLATTDNHPEASWSGFLESGILFGEREIDGLPHQWGEVLRGRVASGGADERLAAADEIVRALGGKRSANFAEWLARSVGSLPVIDSSSIEALAALEIPIVTLNYDSLIEEVTDLPAVTWRESRRMQRVIRGDERGVVHLHGHWPEPESIVFGTESYDDVLADEATREAVRALSFSQSFVFVGFGGPLDNANFRTLREWMVPVRGRSDYSHFRLIREAETGSFDRKQEERERVTPVVYGSSFSDLPPFIRRLPRAASAAVTGPSSAERETDWTKWGTIMGGAGVVIAVIGVIVALLQ